MNKDMRDWERNYDANEKAWRQKVAKVSFAFLLLSVLFFVALLLINIL